MILSVTQMLPLSAITINQSKKEENNMTNRDILQDIFTSYFENQESQNNIALRYNVSQSTVSELLQECGFHRHIINIIDTAWQNPEVQRICDKICKANNK